MYCSTERANGIAELLGAWNGEQRHIEHRRTVCTTSGASSASWRANSGTVRVADRVRLRDAQRAEQRAAISGLPCHGYWPLDGAAARRSAPVVADHAVLIPYGGLNRQWQEGVGGARAVDEDHRLTRALIDELKLGVADGRCAPSLRP